MYECVMGLKNGEKQLGCLLADEMGLGKTLQAITLIYTLLNGGPTGKPCIKKALIVTPASLVENWKREFQKWVGYKCKAATLMSGKKCTQNDKLVQFIAVCPSIPLFFFSFPFYFYSSL